MLSDLIYRLRSLFRRSSVETEMDDELRFHFERQVEKHVQSGLPAEEARRRAQLEFGGLDQVKEECREARGVRFLEALLQDFRYSLRMLRKNPGFTAITILTFALGIGANAAIFTLTYAIILKSLPVPNPGQLVRYTFRNGAQDIGFSGPAYDALRKLETVNTDLLAWSGAGFSVERNGNVERVDGSLLSGNGFGVLELQPAMGRTFHETDDASGGGPNGYQALLGYDYWKQHFQQSPGVLGQTLAVNQRAVTIIGVLPEGFEGLIAGQRTDILLPLSFEEVVNAPGSKVANAPRPIRRDAGAFWLTVMGRLKPGETLQRAAANLKTTEAAVREQADPKHLFLGGFFAPFQFGVESGRAGRSFLKMTFAQPLLVLEILVGLLLLLCCANTALLMLARASSRVREFAVRTALGAPRGRLFQQVLCEAGLVAGGGLCAGLGLGWAAARSLAAMSASLGKPLFIDVTPRAAIVAFTAGITLLSAIGAGLWPAVRASRAAPVDGLKSDTRTSTRQTGRWIVPAQVAVSVTLLIAASLLGSAFLHLLLENSGFHAEGVTLAAIEMKDDKPAAGQTARTAKLMLEAVQNTPGVEAAALLGTPPLSDGWSAGHYFSIGEDGAVHTDLQAWPESVSPRFFATMGIRLLEGREFIAADEKGGPVCILSRSAAAYFFPGERALGKFVYSGAGNPGLDGKTTVDPENTCRVVGLAEDTRYRSLREVPPRMLYQPMRKAGFRFFLAVRSRNSAISAGAIRQAAQRVTEAAPFTIFSFGELVAMHLRKERMLMFLSSCFAAIALLLTSVGLYGLLARSVVVRTREIGVRLALGARPRDAMVLVVWQGMRLVLAGTAIGLAAAWGLTRVLRSLLFGLQGLNLPTLVAVAALLLGVALLASYLPARRAMRLDPLVALRYE